tara:strand:+ start:558 stop:1253 length:696 start_codon:yes stop_codon:yes gene_type:complete
VKKAYWGYTIGDREDVNFPDEFYEPPKKFRSGYDQHYDHVKCPAWKKWGDNCWVVEQPFSVGMKVDTKEKRFGTDLTQKAYENYFHLGDNWLKGKYPEVQMKLSLQVWTKEKDVWIEQIPHPLLARHGFEVIPATFPISVWHRPLVVGLKILDVNQNLMLAKGTPLYYFRLYSKYGDHDFHLEKKDPPAAWHKLHKQSNVLREFAPFKSWEVITQRLSNKERNWKCPFKWN